MPNLNKRQGDIYHIIQERESVEVHDLIAMFDVSAATIRKDLTLLEQSGLVFRTHGEVHIANQNERILSFESRSSLRTEAKKAIAQEAVKTIHEGDSIILDSGSTTLAIAELLRDFQHLTVITNSVPAALTLNNTQLLVIMVGGILHGQNLSAGEMERLFHSGAPDGIRCAAKRMRNGFIAARRRGSAAYRSLRKMGFQNERLNTSEGIS